MTLAEPSHVEGDTLDQGSHVGHGGHTDPHHGVPTAEHAACIPADAGCDTSSDAYEEIIGMLDALGLLGEHPASAGGAPSEPRAAHDALDLDELQVLTGTVISAADIKRRPGWSEAGIRRFLGRPDDFASNPHNDKGPSMRMYLLSRVEVGERRPDFAVWRARAEERSASARRSFELARQTALEVAQTWVPILRDLAQDELLGPSLEDHNQKLMSVTDADEFVPLASDDDPMALLEAATDYLWWRSGAPDVVDSVGPQHRRVVRGVLRDRLREVTRALLEQQRCRART